MHRLVTPKSKTSCGQDFAHFWKIRGSKNRKCWKISDAIFFLRNENISKFYQFFFFFFSSSTANDFATREETLSLSKIYQSSNTNTSLYVYEIHQHFHNCFNSILRNVRHSHTITCDAKKADFWILSHPKSDESCPQKVFDFGVISLCMVWKKYDFGQSLTVQRTSKKSENHQYRFHTVEKRFWFRSRSA